MDEYNIGIDEATFNELVKVNTLKELPKEVSVFLEDILIGLMNNVNNHKSAELRTEFVVGIAPYSHGYNTEEFWERYELILRDLHKVDILNGQHKYWANVERDARKGIREVKESVKIGVLKDLKTDSVSLQNKIKEMR